MRAAVVGATLLCVLLLGGFQLFYARNNALSSDHGEVVALRQALRDTRNALAQRMAAVGLPAANAPAPAPPPPTPPPTTVDAAVARARKESFAAKQKIRELEGEVRTLRRDRGHREAMWVGQEATAWAFQAQQGLRARYACHPPGSPRANAKARELWDTLRAAGSRRLCGCLINPEPPPRGACGAGAGANAAGGGAASPGGATAATAACNTVWLMIIGDSTAKQWAHDLYAFASGGGPYAALFKERARLAAKAASPNRPQRFTLDAWRHPWKSSSKHLKDAVHADWPADLSERDVVQAGLWKAGARFHTKTWLDGTRYGLFSGQDFDFGFTDTRGGGGGGGGKTRVVVSFRWARGMGLSKWRALLDEPASHFDDVQMAGKLAGRYVPTLDEPLFVPLGNASVARHVAPCLAGATQRGTAAARPDVIVAGSALWDGFADSNMRHRAEMHRCGLVTPSGGDKAASLLYRSRLGTLFNWACKWRQQTGGTFLWKTSSLSPLKGALDPKKHPDGYFRDHYPETARLNEHARKAAAEAGVPLADFEAAHVALGRPGIDGVHPTGPAVKAGLVQALRAAVASRRSAPSSSSHDARVAAVAGGLADEMCAMFGSEDAGGKHARELGVLWEELCGRGVLAADSDPVRFPDDAK